MIAALLWLLVGAQPLPAAVTLEAADCPPELTGSIRDELESAGFLTSVGARAGAQVAHVVARCEGARVVVRIEDRVTSKVVERSLASVQGPRSEVLAAIQVVELLHASLAETRFAALLPVPPQVERFLAQREPPPPTRWNFAATGGVSWAPGGFGFQPSLSAAVSRPLTSGTGWQLELGGALTATVHATLLRGTGGEADVGLVEPRALLAVAFERGGWTVRPCVSLGALFVWAVGRAGGAYGAASGATGTFEAALGLSFSRALNPWLALSAGVDAAVAPVPVQVQLPDSTTRIGAPVLSAQLGVVFR